MKTRIVLGVGLPAALVATFLLASARIAAQQQAVDEEAQHRLRAMSQSRDNMMVERRKLEHESGTAMRDLDAREQQLKHELDQLAEKRAALQRSLEQRRAELKVKIDELNREIQASKMPPWWYGEPQPATQTSPKRDSVEAKLDQILKRLNMIETRLDRVEKAVK